MFVNLNTNHSIETCESLLRGSTDTFNLIIGWAKGDRNFYSQMSGKYFAIMHRINYRNSFALIFYGMLSASLEGTKVKGVFLFHPYTMVFLIVLAWLCRNWIYNIPHFIVPIVLFLGIIFIGVFVSRKEPKLIIEYLKNILDAR
jgi:hypothetical protein